MGKAKISKKQKTPSKKSKSPILVTHDPFSAELADPKLIKQVVLQALVDGDLEAVRDVLIAHLQTVNKSKLVSKAKLGRQTMNTEKEFNPSNNLAIF